MNGTMSHSLAMFRTFQDPEWYLEQVEKFERMAKRCEAANLKLGRSPKRAKEAAQIWLNKAAFCRRRANGTIPMPDIIYIGPPRS